MPPLTWTVELHAHTIYSKDCLLRPERIPELCREKGLDRVAITDHDEVTKQALLEPESEHVGRVVMARREDVFVELGGREQGVVPLKQFIEPPEVGAEVKVRVIRFNRDEGLYELTRPGAAANVGDWSDLEEGMVVEAKVTGHNSGGLECDVNRIRGFIPISQISLYRVENLAEFVDEKLPCLVTECNPERRNLVLSRRALLEREREEARRDLLESLDRAGEVEDTLRLALEDAPERLDVRTRLAQILAAKGRLDEGRALLEQAEQRTGETPELSQALGDLLAGAELLEDALEAFAGCAVVISHDRWFLDRIATHILAFEGDSQVVYFDGNYTEYEANRRARLGVDADQPHRIKYRQLRRD